MVQEEWISIWGHVDELRQTILRSLFIIGLGFFIQLGFYPTFLHFLTTEVYIEVSAHTWTVSGQ